jgi:5-methylcytosine-specific restriction endonuclease McrA
MPHSDPLAKLDYQKKYRAKTKQKRAEYLKAYRESHRAEIAAQKKLYRRANLEKLKLLQRAWYARNRHRKSLYGYGVSGSAADGLVEAAQLGCVYCNRLDGLQVDHKTPRSKGGTNEISNLQWLCGDCNRIKGGRTDAEFFDYIKLILSSPAARDWADE